MPELKRPDINRKLSMKALSIANSYVDGYSALLFMREIFEIQKDNPKKYISYSEFFNLILLVCRKSVIISLSNILIRNKDSITLADFEIFLENNYNHELDNGYYKDLLASIKLILIAYSDDSDFVKELKFIRDKYVAHIDKSAFHSPKIPEYQINMCEFQAAFDVIGSFVGCSVGALGINPELINFHLLDCANLQFRLIVDKLE